MSIASDIQKLSPGTLVELFILDATAVGGDVFHFHAGTNELKENVWWQGVEYTRFPVEAEGFEQRATGTAPRPIIRAANVGGVLGNAIRANDDLIGAKITRKRTFVRYLDARNFAAGNVQSDPNVEFSLEIYYVDRKINENRVMVEWELVSAMDLAGVQIPRRQIIANVCPSRYRGGECNYTGGAVATAFDVATTDLAKDVCSKSLTGCKLRFGASGVLRFGGFPAAGLIRT